MRKKRTKLSMFRPAPGRPKTRIEVICPICSGTFEAKPSEIARGAGRYCGYTCALVAAQRGVGAIPDPERPRAPPIERTCETCQKTFMVYPYRATAARPARFCSNECYRVRTHLRAIPPEEF